MIKDPEDRSGIEERPPADRLQPTEILDFDREGEDRAPGGDDGTSEPTPRATPPQADRRAPHTGRTVAQYQVLDKIGEGGMGEVYLAKDVRLDRFAALKFLPAHLHGKKEETERFLREAKSASARDHPNICTIYGIDKTKDGQIFIAMAYYEGRTLRQTMLAGELSLEEALDFARQITLGLEAAHAHGIIHRDIKPENAVVTSDGVVKILDFGLSKIAARPSQLTQAGSFRGTPAYMAPEQFKLEEADVRTDLWALGVVFYEMVTGRLPFEGRGMAIMYNILESEPLPIGSLRPSLPDGVERIVEKCLAKDPEDRYQSAAELRRQLTFLMQETGSLQLDRAAIQEMLEEQTTTVPTDAEQPTAPRITVPGVAEAGPRWNRRRLAALAVVALAAAAAIWHLSTRSRETPPATLHAVLLGFEDADGATDSSDLVPVLTEALALALEDVEGLRLTRAGLPGGAPLDDPETLPAAARAAGADLAIAGTHEASDDGGLRVEIHLARLATGTDRPPEIRRFAESAAANGVLPLVDRLTFQLARSLDLTAARPVAGTGPRTARGPPHPAARRLYAEGLAALRRLDVTAAHGHFEAALEHAPQDPFLRSALAETLWELGREDEARRLAADAEAAAGELPRADRLALRARRLVLERRRRPAAALLRMLWRIHEPQEPAARLDEGLRLSRLLIQTGSAEEALTLLEAARRETSGADDPRIGDPRIGDPRIGDPRIDLAEAEAHYWLKSYDRQLQAARRASEAARELRAPYVLARARRLAGEAHWRRGELAAAREAAGEAGEIYSRESFVKGQADIAHLNGILLYEQGDPWGAKASYDEAARLYGSLGNRTAEARTLSNKALILVQQGDLDANIEVNRRAVELFHQTGDKVAELITLVNLAAPLANRGRFAEAEAAFEAARRLVEEVGRFEAWTLERYGGFLALSGELSRARAALSQALDIHESTDDRLGRSSAALGLSQVLALQGDLDGAEDLVLESLPVFEESGDLAQRVSALTDLASILRARGDLDTASRQLRTALDLQQTRVDRRSGAHVRLALGRVLLEQGRTARAEALARQAVADYESYQLLLYEASARDLLARAVLARGDVAGARAEIDRALALVEPLEEPTVALPLAITACRVLAAEDALAEAHDGLQSLLAEATAGGFVESELEIRLALGELELATGKRAAAGSRLAGVAAEARLKGFGLLADKAERATA